MDTLPAVSEQINQIKYRETFNYSLVERHAK